MIISENYGTERVCFPWVRIPAATKQALFGVGGWHLVGFSC